MDKILLKTKTILKNTKQNFSTNYQKFSTLEEMNQFLNKEKPTKHVILVTSSWNPL
jgi:hypothetical protein